MAREPAAGRQVDIGQNGASDEPTPRERAIGEYLDQLNSRKVLDPKEVLAKHPEHGHEILASIEGFLELTDEPDDNKPLSALGDYTLRRQIGRGGMGVVYEAWENSMDRQVALTCEHAHSTKRITNTKCPAIDAF